MVRKSAKRNTSIRRTYIEIISILRRKEAYERVKKEMPNMAYAYEEGGKPSWELDLIASLTKLYDKGYEACALDSESLK